MSMLAEPRRKQKWTVDPRNTAWSNDDSKFGQRMLEKMGWSKGKGLGAQEQGATEHIKVKVKNNNLGLGATNNNEDNWIAHQDDFNQLLAALNTCHSQETADSSDNKEKKSFSLEEKSKNSKNRVHYMKFTKGKDLSSRSETDLDCIFGKRKNQKTAQKEYMLLHQRGKPLCCMLALFGKDGCSTSIADEVDTSMMTTTTSAFTIQEYFAKRMAQLKSKPRASAPEPDISETSDEWKKEKKKTKEAAVTDVENSPQHKAKRHKKKRRAKAEVEPVIKKRDRLELQPGGPSGDECSEASAEAEEDCEQSPSSQGDVLKSKKRKAKKKLQRPGRVEIDTTLEKAPVKKKKKASR
ncbi:PIN2/TERF1-interacting telomerase inhibitor 1 isoform X1 [Cricetulus griseus]|uniref:PIN2/TERF1-interacting telomerase inhibitor 1 isoform X1 n=2 Tax=Cricetulus griseus TaxID=10029 RepID=A0A9J7J7V0_CRIGR|nr:PIN2/TERF1-interacting telomerase inhibitor 1 isoform X1 [Cricetulus griseus]XP_027246148.1 PIN2/TERF1-interacting telomerase inhibitor 1 isoform X1 [Cricetulus griseus]ERE90209.1 PIN2/TERF1-interacting telomerase inhibitor 1-like protein [Cricetulus griseus]